MIDGDMLHLTIVMVAKFHNRSALVMNIMKHFYCYYCDVQYIMTSLILHHTNFQLHIGICINTFIMTITVILLCSSNTVIGAQIATTESLQEMEAINFPDAESEDTLMMMFGNMTPAIQIPTTVIMNQITSEGKSKV